MSKSRLCLISFPRKFRTRFTANFCSLSSKGCSWDSLESQRTMTKLITTVKDNWIPSITISTRWRTKSTESSCFSFFRISNQDMRNHTPFFSKSLKKSEKLFSLRKVNVILGTRSIRRRSLSSDTLNQLLLVDITALSTREPSLFIELRLFARVTVSERKGGLSSSMRTNSQISPKPWREMLSLITLRTSRIRSFSAKRSTSPNTTKELIINKCWPSFPMMLWLETTWISLVRNLTSWRKKVQPNQIRITLLIQLLRVRSTSMSKQDCTTRINRHWLKKW